MERNNGGRRYIRLDIHKQYVMVAGVNREQLTVLKPRKVSCRQWPFGPDSHSQEMEHMKMLWEVLPDEHRVALALNFVDKFDATNNTRTLQKFI